MSIKQNTKKDRQKKSGREKTVQTEEEKVNEAEGPTIRIICGQTFTQDVTEGEQTVQKRFVSAIHYHDQRTMDLLNHA